MTSVQYNGQSLHWFKSSHSGGAGGDCLEVAALPTAVHVRDSKDTGRGAFAVTPAAWSAFVAHARRTR
ncbi:DUF397 domain-containing protein [Streptomyces sp. NPDC006147]|uniref:DUF397 domain-containing protein n=1 Tax=Streptomyces sp. NPDC006147 TaxID=3155597 RepID=UPI0033A5B459